MTFSGLIAVYLFLGGTSAGAYAVLAVLDVACTMSTWNRHDERNRISHAPKRLCESTYQRIRRIVYGATLCILILGVLCLIAAISNKQLDFDWCARAVAIDGKFVGGFLRCGVFAGSACAACAVGPKSRRHPRRVRGYGIHGNAAEKRCRCKILADDVATGAIRSVCAFVRLCDDNACSMLM